MIDLEVPGLNPPPPLDRFVFGGPKIQLLHALQIAKWSASHQLRFKKKFLFSLQYQVCLFVSVSPISTLVLNTLTLK